MVKRLFVKFRFFVLMIISNTILLGNIDAASLVVSQQNVTFAANVSGSQTQTVKVTGTGILLLNTLTSFEVELTGANSDQFSVESPPSNLVTLLTTLLGGGYNLKISYNPTTPGTHNATVTVKAKLLGIVETLEADITLTGTAQSLDTTAPTVVSTVPASNATGISPSSTISITYSEPVSIANASLITVGGQSAQASVSGSTLSITPGTALSNGTTYQVVIGAGAVKDAANNATTTAYTLSFTTATAGNPSLNCSQQNVSFTANVSGTQTQTVNVTGSNILLLNTLTSFEVILSGTNSNQFSVETPPSNLVTLLTTLLGGGYNLNITYNPTTPGTHNATVTVRAKLLGIAQTLEAAISLTGTAQSLDTTAPTVVSTVPAGNATGVSPGSTISITYNEPVSIANASLITVGGQSAQASVSGNTLSITPGAALSNGTTYQVVIGAGAVKDAANNATTTAYTLSFTTATAGNPSLNVSKQNVSFTSNISGSQTQTVNVTGSNILLLNTLTSFEVVLSGTNSNQFSVETPPSNLVTLLTTLLGGGYNLNITYNPTTPGTHNATVTVKAKLLGIAQTLEAVINLTGTAQSLDTTPPAVVSTVPAGNATGISPNSTISITYNEPVSIANASLITINGQSAQASVSGNTLSITPGAALSNGTTYQVLIGAGAVKDAANNATTTAYTLSFTTATAGSPVLNLSAQSLSFAATVSRQDTKNVNVKVSNILQTNTLTSFEVVLSGTNSNQFAIGTITSDLSSLLSSLKGGGLNIDIAYNPVSAGNHTAKATIKAKFSGIAETLQAEINLSGTSQSVDVLPPMVISTVPADNGTGFSPNSTITVTYNEPIVLADASLISISGGSVKTSVSGNVLSIVPSVALGNGTSYQIVIGAGAVKDAAGNLTNTAYSFSFVTAVSGNPVVNVSSQSLSFNTAVSRPETKNVNLKSSNLLSVNTITSFEVTLSGTNSNQFSIETLTTDYTALLNSLRGEGYNLGITYKPTAVGSHSAKVTIKAKFQNISQTLQAEINLSGTATASSTPDTSAPVVISTVPSAFESGVNLNPAISIAYNENITLANASLIKITSKSLDASRADSPVTESNFQISASGNKLIITPNATLKNGTTYQIIIGAGAVKDLANNPTVSPYSLSFSTTRSGNGGGTSPSLSFNSGSVYFTSGLGGTVERDLVLTGSNIQSTNKALTFDVRITGQDADLYSVDAPSLNSVISSLTSSGGLIIKVKYHPTRGGNHSAMLTVTLLLEGMSVPVVANVNLIGSIGSVTGNEDIENAKNIVSEEIYTISGIRVGEMTSRGIYIKVVRYDDGTAESFKVLHKNH